jgi:DMSO/TMAO reductase YedYZ molybdopterin-dependent catalytic subunit
LSLSRRDFIGAALLAPALARLQPPIGARMLGTVPFGDPSNRGTPLGRVLGVGLDARQFTDVSNVSSDHLVTPTDQFFVRTAATAALPRQDTWSIVLGGRVDHSTTLDITALDKRRQPTGRVLVECAGNSDPANYGLMSVADWEGVPVLPLLEGMQETAARQLILISGFDDETTTTRTSIPGASWIFTREDLRQAFLALRMNGAPLPPNHGAPVRLVIPGWYGCACIKWVNRIELVADDAAATSQMREYAGRTHQNGPPMLARDYIPATIDTAALPVRVEKWTADGKVFYRVIGIVWGGSKPTNALAIRFKTTLPWAPVDNCPLPVSTQTWSLWTHTWRPTEPGRYQIVLRVTDPSIRTRRLDLFFYVRDVLIDQA